MHQCWKGSTKQVVVKMRKSPFQSTHMPSNYLIGRLFLDICKTKMNALNLNFLFLIDFIAQRNKIFLDDCLI